MKFIRKQSKPPKAFTDWLALKNDDWEPQYHALYANVKSELKKALMKEQGNLCCYCERVLRDDDSHVEHFRPQKTFKELALDYGNMLCSCQQELQRHEPRHCGNSKDNWFDADHLISPLDPSCETRFRYTSDGVMVPADSRDEAARQTIRHLQLDIGKLNRMRKAAFEAFLDATMEEIHSTLHQYGMSEFFPFHTAILIYYQERGGFGHV